MSLGRLSQFETLFAGVVVGRGKDYAKSGKVKQMSVQRLDGDDRNRADSHTFSKKRWQYVAQVIGQQRYQVRVMLSEQSAQQVSSQSHGNDFAIDAMQCQCLYEGYCKHLVAVLSCIRELSQQGKLPEHTAVISESHFNTIFNASIESDDPINDDPVNIDAMLQTLDREALQRFVQHCFLRHPHLIDEFVLWSTQYSAKALDDGADSSNSSDEDARVLPALYRQIDRILDMDNLESYDWYSTDFSEQSYQFAEMFTNLPDQPKYQVACVLRWITRLIELYSEYPEAELYDGFYAGFAKLGQVLFAIDENERGIGYYPSWDDGFRRYHTNLPATLLNEVSGQFAIWLDDTDVDNMGADYEISRLQFDIYIAQQDWRSALGFLNACIRSTQNTRYDEYKLESLVQLKIAFLTHLDQANLAEDVHQGSESTMNTLAEFDHLVKVRQILIDQALQRQETDQAIELIYQGIDIAQDKGHGGTVHEWRKQLLKIAQQSDFQNTSQNTSQQTADTQGNQNDKTDKSGKVKPFDKMHQIIRETNEQLAFDGRGGVAKTYYQQWKATFDDAEWQKAIEVKIAEMKHALDSVIKETKDQSRGGGYFYRRSAEDIIAGSNAYGTLAQIYALEGRTEDLVNLLKSYPSAKPLQTYEAKMVSADQDWLISWYEKQWQTQIEKVSDRKQYRELATHISQKVQAIPAGISVWKPMVEQWQDRFSSKPRKPALLDELSKIKWA